VTALVAAAASLSRPLSGTEEQMKTLVGVASLAVVAAMVVLVGFGRASSPLAVAVADAATRCPDGFTVTVHGLAGGSQPTSSLSASCVLDLGIPAGTAGAAGTPGTAGPPGLSGYTLRSTSVKSSKSNSSDRRNRLLDHLLARAVCPAGKSAIGGGARTTVKSSKSNSNERFAITTSEPTPDGNGWLAEASNLNLSKSNINRSHDPGITWLTVTAICVTIP
jgi:glycerate-2-kinase